MIDRERWAQPRLRASMWWCGDDECDCTQPLIELITPNRDVGYPATGVERVWEGAFRSQAAADEYREQRRELYREARRRGIRLRNNSGEKIYDAG